jgi:hypothetical protein
MTTTTIARRAIQVRERIDDLLKIARTKIRTVSALAGKHSGNNRPSGRTSGTTIVGVRRAPIAIAG